MMIFNSFTVTNDYNSLARNDLTAVSFLAKLFFQGICLAIAGKFLLKEFKTIL